MGGVNDRWARIQTHRPLVIATAMVTCLVIAAAVLIGVSGPRPWRHNTNSGTPTLRLEKVWSSVTSSTPTRAIYTLNTPVHGRQISAGSTPYGGTPKGLYEDQAAGDSITLIAHVEDPQFPAHATISCTLREGNTIIAQDSAHGPDSTIACAATVR